MQKLRKAKPFIAPSSSSEDTRKNDPWWKHALVYEVYVRSFQDSNGDGIGDLNGITRRLDYLRDLGADAIWLTPVYPSPQVDFGYDVSDYTAIDPIYGTMADFDQLMQEAAKRGIRVLMDLVMNHTSDKHPWFLESATSKGNRKRDWYIWRDGKGPGVPPNNWQSFFGHSAWTFDAGTGQWYYHKFYAQQPDLNWRNPTVERAMFDQCRFWLDKGVAGFRLDAVTTLFEDRQLRDEKVLPGTNAYGDPNLDDSYTNDLPEVHAVMRALRKVLDSYPGDRVLIGETYLPNVEDLRRWYGAKQDELPLPMDMQVGFVNKLDVFLLRELIDEAEFDLDNGQPLFVFDNHDNIRSWDRYGDGAHNLSIARLLAAILFCTKATAMMYYGQEIGMKTTPPARREDVKDPVGKTGWPKDKGRDGERTPMQWDGSPNAGFTEPTAQPWLPIPASYETVNVSTESKDEDSLLNWYKRLIFLRKTNPAMHRGSLAMLDPVNTNVLSWLRQNPKTPPVVVACNFAAHPESVAMDLSARGVHGRSLTTLAKTPGVADPVSLRSLSLPGFGVYIGEVH